MKGIILAGGTGSRLYPVTKVTSKQLLPIYNKPMIYYPLETLMKAGIHEILIIVSPGHAGDFVNLLGSGKDFGARFMYEVQDRPEGIAQAFVLGEHFIDDDPVALILGDNIFEDDFRPVVESFEEGAHIFVKERDDVKRFGVVEMDDEGTVLSIEEKPDQPKAPYAQTGMYIYDGTVVEKAKNLKASDRGEYEITDLNQAYLDEGKLKATALEGEWIDTGTFESMYEATQFVRKKELKQ